jgi:hypothetical protein
MRWRRKQNQSHWREFEFMLHQLRRVIDPHLRLGEVMAGWPGICRRLAEAPRQRRSRGFHYLKHFSTTS